MSAAMREHAAEAIIGLLVVLLAGWFAFYAYARTGGGAERGGLSVTAQFQNVGGVKVGTEVRIAGLKVGTVTSERIDPKTYMAEVAMALDPATKVPSDSSAAVTSEGLLGGTYIALVPGGDPTPLKNGDQILDTQGSLDLNSLIGQFVNKSGGSGGGSGGGTTAQGPDAATPATTPAPAPAS